MDDAKLAQILRIGEISGDAKDDPRTDGLRRLAAEMGRPPPHRDAPVREVMARLGDNWSALILKLLETGTYRHATLKRLIAAFASESEISQRILTLRLRALERDGFVMRSEVSTNPPRVEYQLTPMGRDLCQQFNQLLMWIESHNDEINAARSEFER